MAPTSRQILDRLPLDGRETGRPGEASSHDAPGAAVHSHVSSEASTAARTVEFDANVTAPCAVCGIHGHSGTACVADDFSADRSPAVTDWQASQPAAPVTESAPVTGAPPENDDGPALHR